MVISRRPVAALAFTVVATIGAVAAQNPNSQPFQAIWNAINTLSTRITAIETSPSPSGSLRVIDSLNQVVGIYDHGYLLRQINGVWYSIIAISADGFVNGGLSFQWDQPDCTGNRYMAVPGNGTAPLARSILVKDGVGYYAQDPLGYVVVQSTTSPSGSCSNRPPHLPQTSWVGSVATIDLAALGVPPFRIE